MNKIDIEELAERIRDKSREAYRTPSDQALHELSQLAITNKYQLPDPSWRYMCGVLHGACKEALKFKKYETREKKLKGAIFEASGLIDVAKKHKA